MKLRVPYWATAGFEVKVNGETICTNPEVSTYVEIDRAWSDGDVVEITMPYTLHLDKTPDKVDGSTVASLMYGPLVMVAKDDRDTYVPMNWYTVVLSENLEDSVEVVTGPDAEDGSVPYLVTNGLHFYPMYDAYNYRYHAYVKVEETQSVVNKDEVQALVDSAADALQENYGEEEWAALQQAEDALVPVSGTEDPGTKPGTDDPDNKPGAGGDDGKDSGTDSKDDGSDGPVKAAQTGDTTPITAVAVLLVVSAAMAGTVIYRKKRG